MIGAGVGAGAGDGGSGGFVVDGLTGATLGVGSLSLSGAAVDAASAADATNAVWVFVRR